MRVTRAEVTRAEDCEMQEPRGQEDGVAAGKGKGKGRKAADSGADNLKNWIKLNLPLRAVLARGSGSRAAN